MLTVLVLLHQSIRLLIRDLSHVETNVPTVMSYLSLKYSKRYISAIGIRDLYNFIHSYHTLI